MRGMLWSVSPLLAIPLLTLAARPAAVQSPGPEAVEFRLRPPLGRVLEFAIAVEAERLDGTPLLNARLVVAQRASAAGANFRFTRYVSFASARAEGPLAPMAEKLQGLAGKSYPLVLDPSGGKVGDAGRKGENPSDAVPSFAFGSGSALTPGKPIVLTGADLRPAGEVVLREVRDLPDGRAMIVGLTSRSDEATGSGTLVVSEGDGMVLLVDLRGELKAQKEVPTVHLHLSVRRMNVPGLDRLAADLGFDR